MDSGMNPDNPFADTGVAADCGHRGVICTRGESYVRILSVQEGKIHSQKSSGLKEKIKNTIHYS